jgi:hypothetical protein
MAATAAMALTALTLPAQASGPCVSLDGHCYASLAAALAAASNGSVITLPAGTFRGGVLVSKGITLRGAGPGRTVLKGGGPVLTIGEYGDPTPPKVVIRDLAITGGAATSSPYSVDFTGEESVWAGGGGISIPPGAEGGRGANVTLADVVVRHNVARPTAQARPGEPEDWPICPSGPCPFAAAVGGGIDNWGRLTLLRTVVVGNTVTGRLASDVIGGGIFNGFGTGVLTLVDSRVSDNHALGRKPWGRFAEGGGIYSGGGTVATLRHSAVTGNSAILTTDFPSYLPDGTYLDLLANGGGMVGTGRLRLVSSRIDDNRVRIVAPNAVWGAMNGGLMGGAEDIVIRNSSISRNDIRATLQDAFDGAPGGTFTWEGVATITGSRFVGNTARIVALEGDAATAGVVAPLPILAQETNPGRSVVRKSVIAGNVVTAVAPHGGAYVFGAGMVVDAELLLDRVDVHGNTAIVRGRTHNELQGGGIWNGAAFGAVFEPPSDLTLLRSRVTGNRLVGPKRAARLGGGIYTEQPVQLIRSVLAGNDADQCVGCAESISPSRRSADRVRGLTERALTPFEDRVPSG